LPLACLPVTSSPNDLSQKEITMSLPDHLTITRVDTAAIRVWLKLFLIALTMLVWLIFAGAILWVLGLVIGPIILVSISALLAYLFYPLVKVCQRFMPRPLAILVVCLLVLVLVGLVFYFVVLAAVEQLNLLINVIQLFLRHPNSQGPLHAFIQFLSDYNTQCLFSPRWSKGVRLAP
jgi:predicted PurR-regulated permease PerM